MPVPTIYFLRHGETEWNALGRLQGTKDVPLNARGRGQAVHAAGVLADLLERDGKDRAALPYVSSPLGRARQTMELARAKLELPPADYSLDDRLREIGYGSWEGLTLAESEAADPEVYARRFADKWTVAPSGGETYAAVQLRMLLARKVIAASVRTSRPLVTKLLLDMPTSVVSRPAY